MLNQTIKITAGGRWRPRLKAQLGVTLLLVGLVLGSGGCAGGWFRFGSVSRSPVAVRAASGDSERLLRNAHYLKLTGRPDLALTELEEAYQHDPGNPQVINALAQTYDEVGELERAQQIYQEALSRNSNNAVLSNNLCFSYYRGGQLEKAEACFRQTLARQPHNVAARNNLGMLLCRLGRREEARRLWQEVEGEALAAGKMNQVLAALGMAAPVTPAAAAPSHSSPKALAETPPHPGPAGNGPVTTPAATPKKLVVAQNYPPTQPETGPPAGTGSERPVAIAVRPQEEPPSSRPNQDKEELRKTAIKVCNGNGMPNLAHKTRALLAQEGFTVAAIANHRDFGVEQTIIYYGPQGERVARTLQDKLFQEARVEPSPALANKVKVQIILGHDLRQRQEILARLQD